MKEKIVKLFYDNQNAKYTINEISKKVEISYSYVHRQIGELKEKNILIVEKQSNRKYCRPNYKSSEVKTIFIKISDEIKEKYFKQKSKLFFLVEKLLSDLPKKTDFNLLSIILFGSRVKKNHSKKSDVDLFFIVSSKEKYDEIIDTECVTLSRGFDVEINPVVSEPKSFLSMLKDKENNIGREIIKNKVILFGAEKFWELVFETV